MTVSEQNIQVIDSLCEKFGLAIDWTSENVVPHLSTLCDKLISYEIWTSVAWMVIILVGFLAALMLIRKYKSGFEEAFDSDLLCYTVGMFLFVVGGAMIAVFIEEIMDIIKCLTFPEMYVFEYIQRVINTAH